MVKVRDKSCDQIFAYCRQTFTAFTDKKKIGGTVFKLEPFSPFFDGKTSYRKSKTDL